MSEPTREQCLTAAVTDDTFRDMPRTPKPGLEPRVCAYLHCPRRGRPFTPKKKQQRFCRDACRWSDWQLKHPRRALTE